MTGYVVFVPAEDAIVLDLTVDEAFRLVISGGVIKPDAYREFVQSAEGDRLRIHAPADAAKPPE
jgi:uncharacterized membrane protein